MCFSASASFLAAVALTPVGLVSVAVAQQQPEQRTLPLACTPLLFAVQQVVEGLIWLTLQQQSPVLGLRPMALTYLGFAYALWPIWMPWCALRVAASQLAQVQRLVMQGLWGLGWLLAAMLWVPLLLDPDLVNPTVHQGSIDYGVHPSWADPGRQDLLMFLYAVIICVPLWLPPNQRLRCLAVVLAASFAIAHLAFVYAFSSVWCYFSAVLSMLVIWIVQSDDPGQVREQEPRAATTGDKAA